MGGVLTAVAHFCVVLLSKRLLDSVQEQLQGQPKGQGKIIDREEFLLLGGGILFCGVAVEIFFT